MKLNISVECLRENVYFNTSMVTRFDIHVHMPSTVRLFVKLLRFQLNLFVKIGATFFKGAWHFYSYRYDKFDIKFLFPINQTFRGVTLSVISKGLLTSIQ